MNLVFWLPTLFVLGLASRGACLAFTGLCPNLTEGAVIYVTVLIVVPLFAYLGVALVRPEWF